MFRCWRTEVVTWQLFGGYHCNGPCTGNIDTHLHEEDVILLECAKLHGVANHVCFSILLKLTDN